jgi:hypothetical protein
LKRAVKFAIAVLLSALVFIGGRAVAAISITVTGDWAETIDENDLIGGAGSELVSDYESASDQVTITISGTIDPSDAWRVDVRKININWDSNLHFYVRRTSDGTGPGGISGGTSYQEVTDAYLSFFSGSGDRSDIHIQLELSGVSVQIPPDNYSITVYYTVVDTP